MTDKLVKLHPVSDTLALALQSFAFRLQTLVPTPPSSYGCGSGASGHRKSAGLRTSPQAKQPPCYGKSQRAGLRDNLSADVL